MTEKEQTQILIAEDSLTQSLKLQLFLEDNGFKVTAVTDGLKALDFLEKEIPLMVISDIEMPDMNGYELCKTIKSDPRFKDIPVLLLTSLATPEDIIKGLECQANNFFTKPFDKDTLLDRVNYIVSNREMMSFSRTSMSLEVFFAGKKHNLNVDRIQILELLLNSYHDVIKQYRKLELSYHELEEQLKQHQK
ncbi:response regulator [Candidatus Pacearchaeota archaeon]|nr:response regulator [Candidatus Pacearchaeota archaeon]